MGGTLGPAVVPRPTARAAFQVVAGEAVLLHVPGSRLVGLNRTGTFLWQKVDGSRTVADLAHLLAGEFDLTYAAALKDVTALLGKLIERDLVEVAG